MEKHLIEFETVGYTILEDAIPEEMQTQLIAALNKLKEHNSGIPRQNVKETAFRGSASHRLRNLICKDDVFLESLTLNIIQELIGKLLGNGFQLFASALNEVGPGEKQQRIHTDDILIPFPRPIPFPVVINTIWALSDFMEENGATRIVPKSHQFKDLPTPDCLSLTIPVLMKKGSILVYHGSIWHGAGANNSAGDKRTAYILTFCSQFVRPYENQMKLFPRDRLDRMSLPFQQMLGFKYIPQGIKKNK